MSKDVGVFSLKGGEVYITERDSDAFRIRKGSVYVYVVPMRKNRSGRRAFLCEMKENEVLPGFYYTDSAGQNWRFLFVAGEEAGIERIENGVTALLKERFIERTAIRNLKEEGFAGCLVDYYRLYTMSGDGLVRKNRKRKESTEQKVHHLIRQALRPEKNRFNRANRQKRTEFLSGALNGMSQIRMAGLEEQIIYEYMKSEIEEQSDERAQEKSMVTDVAEWFEEGFGTEGEGIIPERVQGEILLDGVSFSYGQEEVLKNLNLHIRPGEYIGIVGPSGCGKSTLLRLLLGLEQPDYGQIYYDGTETGRWNMKALRKHMGVVLQEDKLISGNIYENITITMPTATPEQVDTVVKAVGLEEDLRNLPMGLFTIINEDGTTLSSGQRQRILIARALLRQPEMVFFDEATSLLDEKAQDKVSFVLEQMNCTRIVIAHRLRTVRYCDRILVMDAGKITEQGTFEELMKKRGLFFGLASRQMPENESV